MMRPLVVVLGELAYLRPWIRLAIEGDRYKVTELYQLAARDLYWGTRASKQALMARLWEWDNDPDGRTRIWRHNPEGRELYFEEVAP